MAGSNKNKLTMLLGSFYILFGTMESMATNIPLPQLSSLSIATSCSPSRGMLLWTTKSLLSNPAEQDQLISLSLSSKITDIYAYLVKSDYSTFQEQLQTFNSKLNNAGIKIWGMEGYRGYFSDAYGPSELYAAANALSTFNSKVNSNSRFAGFYMNMQPQDGQGDEFKTTFHNDLCDSNLDPVSGGVWFDSELKDREMLMRDWLLIAQSLRQKMNEAGLRLGAAMPSWTDDYYDEEILVSFNGIRQGLMKHMMQILNDYVVMSYNTNPRNAANRLKGELAYADTLPVSNRPRVFGGLETHPGSGKNVSYADTEGKSNRTTVIQDIQTIQEILGEHDSFCGINLSDWEGWKNLNPSAASIPPAPSPAANGSSHSRGMWLWTTQEVLSNINEQNQLISLSLSSKVTDIYAYLVAADYSNLQAELQAFNSKLNHAGIKIWGMEGYRGYFSDAYGPSGLYAAADAVTTFNSKVNPNERFAGFHSDMEPQDGQGSEFKTTFHNDLKDSSLNQRTGGVWYASQTLDREMLMRDWLQIMQTLKQKMANAGLKLGAAMPSWTDNYYDEEVLVSFNGLRQGVMKHMMRILDDYVIMSYNTNPKNVARKLIGAITYADSLPVSSRPRVFGGLETHKEVGSTISYADTSGKSNRSSVMKDIQTIQEILGSHESFYGMNLHDWMGWRDLKP